jgi:hypothetical protein
LVQQWTTSRRANTKTYPVRSYSVSRSRSDAAAQLARPFDRQIDLLSSRGRTQTSLLGHGCYTPQAHDIRLKASVFGKSKGNPRILRPRHQHLPQQAVDSLVEAFVARLQRSIEAEKTHSQMNSYCDWISHLLG